MYAWCRLDPESAAVYEVMMLHPVVHGVSGIILLIAHGTFLFRGLAMRKTGGKPGKLDWAARFISNFGLPLTIVTGFLVKYSGGTDLSTGLHVVPGLLPLAAIFGLAPFLSLRRRLPWLLPGINLIFIAAAAAVGLMPGRVLQ